MSADKVSENVSASALRVTGFCTMPTVTGMFFCTLRGGGVRTVGVLLVGSTWLLILGSKFSNFWMTLDRYADRLLTALRFIPAKDIKILSWKGKPAMETRQ